MLKPPEKAELEAPHIRIVKIGEGDDAEWKAVPDECYVKKSEVPFIIIEGPEDPSLEGVWFETQKGHEAFGGTWGQHILPDANVPRLIMLPTKDVDYDIYKYGFRIDGKIVDPKIIIERP